MGKIHTTNYFNTFIEVAEDTKVACGTKPPSKADKKTIAEMQYALLAENPYKFTSDEVLFQVFADRNDLTQAEYDQARQQFFSKGQPCFRTSPLTKYLWFRYSRGQQRKSSTYRHGNRTIRKFPK